MSQSQIEVWDGTRKAHRLISTDTAGQTTVVVGVSSISVLPSKEARRAVYLENLGSSHIYLSTGTATAGATGANFSQLPINTRIAIDYYSGSLTAIGAGASGDYQYLKILDIG